MTPAHIKREIHETAEHVANQRAIKNRLLAQSTTSQAELVEQRRIVYTAEETEKLAYLDYKIYANLQSSDGATVKSKHILNLECKQRETLPSDHTTYMLSEKKWRRMHAKALRDKVPSVFAAGFRDKSIRYIVVDKTPEELGYTIRKRSGRTKATRDAGDIESCIFIPMRDLLPLRKMPALLQLANHRTENRQA